MTGLKPKLAAPFPYYGGKSRFAPLINARLGDDVAIYVEPFAGSLAVLLGRDPAQREIVCDLDGMVANFWRAMAWHADEVAAWADWPTIHQDLTARHTWLRAWKEANGQRLSEDPEWCDPKVAGWWAWGLSNWIGGGWCETESEKRPRVNDDGGGRGVNAQRSGQRPHVDPTGSGQGVQPQRLDKRPHVGAGNGGQGTQAQRRQIPKVLANAGGAGVSTQREQVPYVGSQGGGQGVTAQREQMPYVNTRGGGQGVTAQRAKIPKVTSTMGATGVQAQRAQIPKVRDTMGAGGVQAQRETTPGDIGNGDRLLGWFLALQQRLARVVVLNRDWRSALTPTLLQRTRRPFPPAAVFLDPPYRLDTGRSGTLYNYEEQSQDAAEASFAWALEHGDDIRVAYACHVGDFPIPDGWTAETMSLSSGREGASDMVMFSPACAPRMQERLL